MLSPINWPSLNKIEIYIRKKRLWKFTVRCNEVQDGAQDSEWIHFGGRSRRNWGNASGSSTDWSNAAEVTGPVRAGRSPPNPSPVSSLPPTHTSVSTSKRTSFRWTRRRLRDVTSMDRPSLLTIVFLDHSHVYGIHFFLENAFVHCSHHLIDDEGIVFDQIGAQRDTTRHCRFGEDQSKRH